MMDGYGMMTGSTWMTGLVCLIFLMLAALGVVALLKYLRA